MKAKQLLATAVMVCAGVVFAADSVVLENGRCRLVLDKAGCALSLIDKTSGEELLMPGVKVPFATFLQNRPYDNEYKLMLPAKPWTHRANRIERRGNELLVGFEDAFEWAVFDIRETDAYIGLSLKRIDFEVEDFGRRKRKTEIDAMAVMRLPMRRKAHLGSTLNAVWDDKGAAAVLAARAETRVDVEPREDGGLLFWGGTEAVPGVMGLSAALVVAPREKFLDAVDSFEREMGMPCGVASRRRPDIREACYYIPIFKPDDLDAHIAAAKKGGFGLFMFDLMDLVKTTGTYELKDCYPGGLADLAAISEKVRAAGLRMALHGYPTKVAIKDPLATTKLDPRLNAVCELVLAEDAAADATELVVEGNRSLLRMENARRLLQIGRELVAYGSAGEEDGAHVFRLKGCTRAAHGTVAAAHSKGERLRHLDVDDWPVWIRADPMTSLQAEMADHIWAIWKAMKPVMFYFDGAEDVPDPYWHYVPKAQMVLYERLDPKPLFCESALKSHFGWHINSRGNAFDVFAPERIREAMKKYILRCAAQDAGDFTCVDFGWQSMRLPRRIDPKKVGKGSPGGINFGIGMQPDHFEYVFSKSLAWDSPVTVQFSREALDGHPRLDDGLAVISRWEQAKRERRYSSAAERAALRDPEREFFLLDFGEGGPELVECRAVTRDAEQPIRAFSFMRKGLSGIVYWNMFEREAGEVRVSAPDVRRLSDGGRKILLSSMPEDRFAAEFRGVCGNETVPATTLAY